MSLKFGVLGLLNYGSMTGYDINLFFNRSLAFFWKAQTCQIYRELKNLEGEGYVMCEEIVQYDKPNKKIFHITEAGRTALVEWLNENCSLSDVRNTFLLKLFLSGFQDKERTIEQLKGYISEADDLLHKIEKVEETYAYAAPGAESHFPYWTAVKDFGVMYEKMCIEWAEQIIALLEKM